MRYKLGRTSRRKMVGLHPIIAFAVEEAIKISDIDFGVLDGVRSMKRQKYLVAKGRSKTFRSYHLYGLAVDLVPFVHGRYTWDDKHGYFEKIDEAMKTVIAKYHLPIESGFDKWGWDKPHWQMTGYKAEYDIRRIDKRFA